VCNMAASYWSVPIRLRAFNLCHRMQILWMETEGVRCSPGQLGFVLPAARCGSGCEQRRASGDRQRRRRSGRGAGEGGEFGDVVESPVRFLNRCRDPAGVSSGGGDPRVASASSFCGQIRQTDVCRGCYGIWGRE
jgi:hypothetical protein